MAKWKSLHRQLRQAKSGQRVVREMDRASAFLRDVFNESFAKIHVDSEEWATEVKQYLQEIAPDKTDMVKLYNGAAPIFQHFNVDRQVKTSFGRTVTLQKGAYLIIEHTEALHVIDVNSGNRGAVGESQEEGALAVNLLAAEEVARQLRLRDMGGIIVVDFIDLHKNEHRRALYDKVKEVMSQDRAKHKILPPSKFGLVEITRQRVRPEKAIETQEENPDALVDAPILLVEKLEQEYAALANRFDPGQETKPDQPGKDRTNQVTVKLDPNSTLRLIDDRAVISGPVVPADDSYNNVGVGPLITRGIS
jgi:ribonuclease G